MQGAGGIILGNHLYSVAAPDGLTLGMPGRSGFLLSNVVRQKNISYDLDEILLYRRRRQCRQRAVAAQANRHQHDRRPEEFQEGDRDRRRSTRARRTRSRRACWQPTKAGRSRSVTGYPGFNEVLIAIERGEVDGLFSHEGSIANSRPDMITSGMMKPIVQSFDGMPDVPVLADVVTDAQRQGAARPGDDAEPHRAAAAGTAWAYPPIVSKFCGKSYMRLMDDAGVSRRSRPARLAGRTRGRRRRAAEARSRSSLSSVPERVVKEYMAITGLKAEE